MFGIRIPNKLAKIRIPNILARIRIPNKLAKIRIPNILARIRIEAPDNCNISARVNRGDTNTVYSKYGLIQNFAEISHSSKIIKN
jgi:hypothetical protein